MRKGATKNTNYDYEKLESEYLASDMTLRQLAKLRSVPYGTLYDHARRGKWEERRKKRKQKRINKRVLIEEKNQDEAWLELQNTIRSALTEQWRKLLNDDEMHLSAIASLTKATKDAREMGIFGITTDEIKKQKEVDKLKQEINAAENNDAEIIINGGGDYGA